MRIPSNKYLVRVDGLLNDAYITESGMKFYKDLTVGNKEWNKKTDGELLLCPEKYTNTLPTRCTHTNKSGDRQVVMHDAMPMVLQKGDKVYFNYLALQEKRRFIYDGFDPTKFEFFLHADHIQAYERDGVLHANAGRLILEHVEESIAESKSLIIPESFKRTKPGVAKVVASGPPFKGYNDPEIKPGDLVAYKKDEADYIDEHKKRFAVYLEYVYLVFK